MSILVNNNPDLEFDERPKNDFYPTPFLLCEKALDLLPNVFFPRDILDPGAGAGPWGMAARSKWPSSYIEAVELNPNFPHNPAYNNWRVIDFLDTIPTPLYDLVIGNPPYGKNAEGKKDKKMAEKFVRHGMACLKPGGYLMFLLLLNFATTANRVNGLYKDYPLYDVIPLVQRPPFKPGKDRKTGELKPNATDEREYGIFIFQKGGQSSKLRWLDWKPKNVRRRNGKSEPRAAVAENNS